MTPHDDALDNVALLAMGMLPAAEADAVLQHVRTCEDCAREYRDLRPIADLVGYAAENEPLSELQSARMRSRVLRAIAGSDGAGTDAQAGTPLPAADATAQTQTQTRTAAPAPTPLPQRRPWVAYLAAAAAIVVALLSSFNNAALRNENDDAKSQIADLRKRVAADEMQARASRDLATADEQRLADALAGGDHFAIPVGQVVRVNGRIVMALHLKPLPAGKVYQAWTLAANAKTVAPSITFRPDARGIAVVELPRPAAGLVAVAVSVEPLGGSKAPTSQPTFLRKLS